MHDEDWATVTSGAGESVQPQGGIEGLSLGIESFKRSVGQWGRVLWQPVVDFQHGATNQQIWKSLWKGIPVAILRPVIGITEATATTLRGVRNEIDSEKRTEYLSKYKTPSLQ